MVTQANTSREIPSDRREFGESIFERDDHTCQRCGDDGTDGELAVARLEPLADGDGAPPSEASPDPENHLALCRSCLAVTRPDDDELREYRSRASLYPAEDADPRVAYVNSETPYESVEAFFDRVTSGGWLSARFGTSCERCDDRFDPDELVVFPARSANSTHPGEQCESVCRACAGLVVSSLEEPLPAPILDSDGNARDGTQLRERAAAAKMTGGDGRLDAERDPVNRKERLLNAPVVGTLHRAWGWVVTLVAFVGFLYLFGRDVAVTTLFALETLPVFAQYGDVAVWVSLSATGFLASVGATTVRWSLTWVLGQLWRVDPSVSAQHYRRQVFWRWRDVVGAWTIAFGILGALPVVVPLLMLHAFLTNESETDGRQPTTGGRRGHDWSRTVGWWFVYK